ncbi:hypothetical protein B0T24DRAFT_718873 [Lasiosphaeria ovina]|uniref:Glycosyltransferase family 1 protein n=1 Tax=Lasiosphaeria ovina TaxID=92902 RepID=A0AAE0KHX6_9PEZI|nr:hypothetical protein B0T24DRAFT_718873 [Lasiosphaeria ovina]
MSEEITPTYNHDILARQLLGEDVELSKHGPPCYSCDQASGLYTTSPGNPNGNAGRKYYRCRMCPFALRWVTWADAEGVDDANPLCNCKERSRADYRGVGGCGGGGPRNEANKFWTEEMAQSKQKGKPFLLFACHPLTGHFTPVCRIAAGLRERGWADISFLGSTSYRARIEGAGLEFMPVESEADHDDTTLFPKQLPGLATTAPGTNNSSTANGNTLPPSIIDSNHQTLDAIPAQWSSVKTALATLHARDPRREIIILCEAFFYGMVPLRLGAALPAGVPRPRSICISITPPAIRSADLPPFASAERAGFDPSPAGHARNAALWEQWTQRHAPELTERLADALRRAGASRPLAPPHDVFMSGGNYVVHDAVLQVGLPAFEYPRADFPAGFRIVGVLPPVAQAAKRLPWVWWDEDVVAAKKDGRMRKIVVVAQGTVETEPTELIIPTLQILAGRGVRDDGDGDDILTIAILGSRGARLAPEHVPANARVVDYLAYDAVLPYADVWVHNGGYGATMHGIAHGVPMVIAGEGQDKLENGRRVAWSGLGVDLACARPPRDALAGAIDEVLRNPTYKEVARRMQETARSMDCFKEVEDEILKLAGHPEHVNGI